MKTLQSKRVLVTGGAGGLGHAMARRFAAEGAELVLTDVASDVLADMVADFTARGVACRGYTLDVTDVDAIHAVRQRLHADAGPLDVLVNNAGIVTGGPFLDVPLDKHLATYRVNIDGVMAMTHAFLPDLVAAAEGHLVNLASAAGFIGLPYGATYASSKWAVIGLSESLRLEMAQLGHDHVGVTTVCPLYVDTGMFAGVRPPRLTRFLKPDDVADKVVAAVLAGRPFVLEPWLVKITPFLRNSLPRRVGDLLADLFGASTGMKTWTGRRRQAR
ncbi:MAG TPA: SDR family NAD(P)-dependent oxidoreductase [Thermoanaerobaculia bacterium]|nr:SDR family NAD(P)-dependent oxidoreductase [Thermoanaerobaculia bacterium]